MLVEVNRLTGIIEKRQDLTINLARNVEIAIDESIQPDERPKLGIGPVLDQDHAPLLRLHHPLRCGLLEVKQIAALAACNDLSGAVNDIGFFQATLDP